MKYPSLYNGRVVVGNGGSRLPSPAADAALDDDGMGYIPNNLFPRLMQECIHCVGVSYSPCLLQRACSVSPEMLIG